MNKKLLCCILIACTLITSGTIIYVLFYDSENNVQAEEVLEVENEEPQEIKKEDLKKNVEIVNNKENVKKSEANVYDKETKKSEETKESSGEKTSQESSSSIAKKEEAKSVFKVNYKSIEDSLSSMDKAKLLFIENKLSTVDEGRVKDYLSDNDHEEGVKKVYKLLKQRLNEDDFNKVKEILERYINIDVVENQ